MKYKNKEEFLNKMYTNMYLEQTVKSHTTNKDTPEGKIGGYLCLEGLTSAEGLVLPKEIGRSLYLNDLTNMEYLFFPESYIYIKVYTSAKISYIPDEEYFNKEKKKIKKIN